MGERYLSSNIIEAVAKDFLASSIDLSSESSPQEVGVTYEINGSVTTMRTEKTDGAISGVKLDTADFIGGVIYTLAQEGVITSDEASPNNVAKVAFALGSMFAQGGTNG